MSYKCWGPDGEDLTPKVEAAIQSLPSSSGTSVVFGTRLRNRSLKPAKRSPRKVMVTCAAGHKNVFTVGS